MVPSVAFLTTVALAKVVAKVVAKEGLFLYTAGDWARKH
jgi:hypothetical protein